ncbi:MAG TPA: hypothetical protein PK280_05050 [Planctomycetota bacterium]|nr:hypothetical protein [Planctomycetota bacterium]
MSFRSLLLGIFRTAVYAAAALFLLLLGAVAVLHFTGHLDRRGAVEAWSVLREGKVAMTAEERDRLADFDRRAKDVSEIQRAMAEGAGEVRKELDRRGAELEAGARREREYLTLLSRVISGDQARLSEDSKKLAESQRLLTDAQKTFQNEKDRTRLSKVLKLYAGIEAEIIAVDFEERLKTNDKTRFNEVVELLRQMPERQASDVLSAIARPDVRNSLMEALKKS